MTTVFIVNNASILDVFSTFNGAINHINTLDAYIDIDDADDGGAVNHKEVSLTELRRQFDRDGYFNVVSFVGADTVYLTKNTIQKGVK